MATGTNRASRSLQLTPAEESLRQLLLDVASHINLEHPTDLRFTGGWVRDKLLGIGSHDIDVGINDMTGYQFGLRMKEYLALPGNESKYGAEGVSANLHKIEANPEKSKHLETVTTKIFGLDVDLVNLRKETYTEESRNPQMEFGTPQEDAMRRDATVNAMFYNLRTKAVEDLTGKGHNDLRDHIIRTPLEPFQTFKDDPLRVLRLIRFASRFDYTITVEAEEAMGDPSIKQALRAKISRERVGVEIEKMLKGPHPHMGLSLIDRLNLFDTVFTDPEHDHEYQPDTSQWHIAYDTASEVIGQADAAFHDVFSGNSEQAYVVWILSCVVPWADAPIQAPPKAGGKQPPPPAFEVARNGLKAPTKICDIVRDSVFHAEEIIQTKDACLRHLRQSRGSAEAGSPAGRDVLGMLIRQWGQTYKSQLTYALFLEAVRSAESGRDIASEFLTFISHISTFGLLDAPNFKPVVDGKTLAKELDARPGPWMKSALDEVMAWQLQHPDDASPEAAVQALRNKHGELPSRLVVHFLTLTIRPLFLQTKTHSQAGTTSQGRKVINSQSPAKGSRSLDEIETSEEATKRRPWKEPKHSDCFQLLDWCLQALRADQKRTEQNWPLVIPPILALIDDVEVRYKAQGCHLLTRLLEATPSTLLALTGLGQVFQDAVTPCLSYLPTLTAEDEAIVMLDAAYPALMQLANVRHSTHDTDKHSENLHKRERLLVHILHHHLLRSLAHVEAQDYPRLTSYLLRHLASLSSNLGLGTVAQLTYMVPAVSAVLACEVGRYAGEMLADAARCFQRIIAETWPRIWRWRGEILKGVCLAWVQAEASNKDDMKDTSPDQLSAARQEMRRVVQMLLSAIDATKDTQDVADIDFKSELAELVEADPGLKDLVELD